MSLFKVKDTWITKVNNRTELQNDADIIHIGSLLSEDKLACQIIHASSDGTLTIYFPNDVCGEQPRTTAIGNEPPCLVHKYEEPILKVLTGRFSPENPQQTYLAVLLPSKLIVCQLYVNQSSGDCSETILEYWTINAVFEVTFTAAMFNMCCGLLFEEDSYDSICIQSVDSVLHVYSGTTHVASARIPDTLLPGPLVYSNCYHSIITATSSRVISCYKVEDILENYLSHSMQRRGYSELLSTDTPNDVAMAVASWSVVVGEPVFQMEVIESLNKVEQSSPKAFVIAICRDSILLLSETGQRLGVRHLQLTPKILCPIGIGTSQSTDTEEPVISLQPKFCVATEEEHLLVFQGLQLVWSAKLLWSPVDMSMPFSPHTATSKKRPIIGRNSVPGLIALLGPESQLTLSYLGTSPPNGVGFTTLNKNEGLPNKSLRPGFLTRQELSLSQELAELNRRIKNLLEEKSNLTVHMEKVENNSKKTDESDVHIEASVSSDSTQTYFLDVSVQLSPNSRVSSSDPMSLNIHSCPPIVVVPNYLTIPAVTPQPAGMFQKFADIEEFHHNCRLSVAIDAENPLTRLTPQDLNVRLVLGYWLRKTDTKSSDTRQVFKECCVKLPLNLVFSGKPCEKQDVAGLYQLKFDITQAIDPLNWNVILPAFASSYMGSSFCLWRSALPQSQQDDEHLIDTQWLYITLNCAKRTLKLRTSSEDMLWPVLNDIHTRVANTLGKYSTSFAEEPLLPLYSSPCTSEIPVSFRCTSILPNTMVQLNPLIDCLFRTLQLHLEARIQMATLAAKNTIQSRHFRMVQKHVLDRIKDNIPAKLNGFDALLERNICALIEGCDQALNASLQQVLYGVSAVSLIILLGFISANCITKGSSTSRSSKFTSIFQVAPLQAVVEATEMLETNRGYSTIPGGQDNEDDADSTKPPAIGLEECLRSTMLKLLGNTEEKSGGEKDTLSQELNKTYIPDIGWIIEQFQMLCCKFAGHRLEPQKLPKISAPEMSPEKDEPEKTMDS